ncbi:MAG: c-type cytochrome [Myxococcota bacterium]
MRRVAAALGLLWAAAQPALAGTPPVEEDYWLQCAACHGADGGGTPGVTPSLREVGPLLAAPGGRAYLARVPGVAQAPLSDARLARLLNWVLEHQAGAPPRPPYSAAEIGALRSDPLRDTRSAREALFEDSP